MGFCWRPQLCALISAAPQGPDQAGGEGHTETPILFQLIHPRGFSPSAASLKTIVILCSAPSHTRVRPACGHSRHRLRCVIFKNEFILAVAQDWLENRLLYKLPPRAGLSATSHRVPKSPPSEGHPNELCVALAMGGWAMHILVPTPNFAGCITMSLGQP